MTEPETAATANVGQEDLEAAATPDAGLEAEVRVVLKCKPTYAETMILG